MGPKPRTLELHKLFRCNAPKLDSLSSKPEHVMFCHKVSKTVTNALGFEVWLQTHEPQAPNCYPNPTRVMGFDVTMQNHEPQIQNDHPGVWASGFRCKSANPRPTHPPCRSGLHCLGAKSRTRDSNSHLMGLGFQFVLQNHEPQAHMLTRGV